MDKPVEKWKESSGNSCSDNVVALIACSSKKAPTKREACKLYQGELFKKSVLYCKQRNIKYFILSAKYGLISPDQIISPYNLSLNNMNKTEKKNWYMKVNKQLYDEGIEEAIILAGKNYHEGLNIKKIMVLPSKGIGYQLHFLQNQIKPRGIFDEQ